MSRWPHALFYGVFFLVIAADQLVKLWAMHHLGIFSSISVVPGFFDLTYVENTGVAFGLMPGKGLIVGVVIFVSLLITILATQSINWIDKEMNCIAGLLCGGALSNLLDRARFGYVVDMINVHAGNFHWPVFNVADSAICVAIGWILAKQIFQPESKTQRNSATG